MRGTTPPTRPQRLAHVLMFTANLDASLEFFADVLGLKLSDRSGGVAFMHGAHGSDHHLLAFAQSDGYGLHHSAWTVGSIDEIGLGSERMSANGYSRGWGVGRHVLGSNYFRYIRDPWGGYAEYSFDIDFIPAAIDWQASSPAAENSPLSLGAGACRMISSGTTRRIRILRDECPDSRRRAEPAG